jgi:DNA-binding CsgD family transcriptional regulator
MNIEQKIIKLREENKTIPYISALLNVSNGTVGYYLKKNNLNKEKITLNKNEEKLIIEYISIGKSQKEISNILNINKYYIKKYIKENNIKYTVKNKEEKNKQKSKNVINWKKEKKKLLIEYKGGKCIYCGYNKCIAALEFHHKDPKEKDFSIANNSYSFEKMKNEVDKCELVCSNCHREIHYGSSI